jgi:hypothetical protein
MIGARVTSTLTRINKHIAVTNGTTIIAVCAVLAKWPITTGKQTSAEDSGHCDSRCVATQKR